MVERLKAIIRRFDINDLDQILEIEKHAFPKTAYPRHVFVQYAQLFPDTFFVAETGEDVAADIAVAVRAQVGVERNDLAVDFSFADPPGVAGAELPVDAAV